MYSNAMNDDIFLAKHGYIAYKESKLCNSLGKVESDLFVVHNENKNGEPSVIKKLTRNICNENKNGEPSAHVSSVIKRFNASRHSDAFASHRLAIVSDVLLSETHVYIVVEYNFNTRFSDFVTHCHEHVQSQKLDLKQYHKTIKRLLRTLADIIALKEGLYMFPLSKSDTGNSFLKMDSVMVKNADFIVNVDGSVSINSDIDIVYLGMDLLICELSPYVSVVNKKPHCLLPDLTECVYDSDIFTFGLISLFCFANVYPCGEFETEEKNDQRTLKTGTIAWAILNSELRSYVLMHGWYMNSQILSSLTGLLNSSPPKRMRYMNVRVLRRK